MTSIKSRRKRFSASSTTDVLSSFYQFPNGRWKECFNVSGEGPILILEDGLDDLETRDSSCSSRHFVWERMKANLRCLSRPNRTS